MLTLLLGAALASASAGPNALADKGVVILCYETADAKATGRCALEAPVRSWLIQQGAFVVDAAQTAKIRSAYTPERFQIGRGLDGVDLLDAELGVVIKMNADQLGQVGKVKTYDVGISAMVLDVSRGNIIAPDDRAYQFKALSARQALGSGVKKWKQDAQAAFTGQLLSALSAPVGIELWVYDVQSLDQVRGIDDAIGKSKLSASHRRTAFTGGLAKWRLRLNKGARADDLAVHLEKAGIFLSVQGSTGGMVQLAYDPSAHIKASVKVSGSAKRKVPAWFSSSMVDLAKGQLMSAGWLEPTDGEAMLSVDVVASKAKRGRYALTLTLKRAGNKKLAAVRKVGKEGELAQLQAEGIEELLGTFRKYLEKRPGEMTEIKRIFDAPDALTLELKLAEADGALKGGKLNAYDGAGIGSLAIKPKLDDARYRVRVAGATEFTAWQPMGSDATLKPQLQSALAKVKTVSAYQVEVEVEGKIGERMYRERGQTTALYHPVNTVDWNELKSLASLVDPGARWAQPLLPKKGAAPRAPTEPLGLAAEVWAALGSQGLVLDEAAAADERFRAVRLPEDTLREGKGDRAALSVLVATALETAGLETRLVRVPGRVLLAVESGLPADGWAAVAGSAKEVVIEGGRVFVPVDVSTMSRSFWGAVDEGLGVMKAQGKRAELASPRKAPRAPVLGRPVVAKKSEAPLKILVLDVRGDALSAAQRGTLQANLAQAFADAPELAVMTTADVKELIDLEAQKQLVGCEEASCLSEITGALGARVVLLSQVGKVGKRTQLSIAVTDTARAKVTGRAQVKDAIFSSGPDTARRLVAELLDELGRSGGAWSYAAQRARLRARLPKDAYQRARAFVLMGDAKSAQAELAKVRNKPRQGLLEAHLLLLAGDSAAAQKGYAALKGDAAELGEWIAKKRQDPTLSAAAPARLPDFLSVDDDQDLPYLLRW